MDDAALEAGPFRRNPALPADTRPISDWHGVHRELPRTGVTLMLL